MNFRPYPDPDRALAQLERGRVPSLTATLRIDTSALEAALRPFREMAAPQTPMVAWVDEHLAASLQLTDWQRRLLYTVAAPIPALAAPHEPNDPAAVTPPPALTEEGHLRARVQVLEEDAERAEGLAKVGARCVREGHQGRIESGRATIEGHRFALTVKLGLGTAAPWDAIHDRVADLSRIADETAVSERCENCGHAPHGHAEHQTDPAALTDCPHCPCAAELRELSGEEQPASGARQDEPDHVCNTVQARGEMDEPLGYLICGICGKPKSGAQQ
ncbi:hypothetical protein [Streptomyces sp. NPDC045251]|uniref:hypothetical protein n=1 Tax=unclassified Streptomyces TaxID=2593676 RepID=UPI0033E1DB63